MIENDITLMELETAAIVARIKRNLARNLMGLEDVIAENLTKGLQDKSSRRRRQYTRLAREALLEAELPPVDSLPKNTRCQGLGGSRRILRLVKLALKKHPGGDRGGSSPIPAQ